MSFTVPAFEDSRTAYLRDVKNQLPDADTGPDSDTFVRASANSSAVEGLYTHQKWLFRQIFPDSSDPDVLVRHAATRGLQPKAAVSASGTMRVLGAVGKPIDIGLQGTADSGQVYTTTAAGVIGADGTAVVTAVAAIAGAAGTAQDNTPVTLTNAPDGIQANAVLVTMPGGVDAETSDELLARLLDVIRNPPAGGNAADYRRWAMNTPGVTNAIVYPLRRGLGTVDVCIVSGTGLPSADTIAAVQANIEAVRPVTAKGTLVFAPTLVPVDMDIEVDLDGVTLDAATAGVESVLGAQFDLIAPGDTWVRSQSESRVSDVSGVTDRKVVTPAGNIVPEVDATVVQWLRLGTVNVTLMA
jgi:uncharacterized phage protein gp47/JayE